MRNVRQEVFSALEPVDPAYLKQVSDQMLQICEVSSTAANDSRPPCCICYVLLLLHTW